MQEVYGFKAKARVSAIMLLQALVFGGAWALTLEARSDRALADLATRPAVSAVLFGTAACLLACFWLLGSSLQASAVRNSVPFAPLYARISGTIFVSWAATAAAVTLALQGESVAARAMSFRAFEVVGALPTLFFLVCFVIAFHAFVLHLRFRSKLLAYWRRFRAEHAGADLRRLEQFVEQEAKSHNPGLILRGMWFPAIGSRPQYDASTFPWFRMLEESFEEIRDEVLRAYASRDGIERYTYLGVADRRWQCLMFRNNDGWNQANCLRCPKTAAILRALPISLVREAMISVQEPGSWLKPHRDPNNMALTCHFGIRCPSESKIRIAGEVRGWEEGRCMVFDTSYEHEVWNFTDEPRIILMFDFLHPELTDVERSFFPSFVAPWLHASGE